MDRGAWQATAHGVTKSDTTEQLTIGPSNSAPRYLPKVLCTNVHGNFDYNCQNLENILGPKPGKNLGPKPGPKYPSMGGSMSWCICTMGYSLAVERNKLLTYSTTWMHGKKYLGEQKMAQTIIPFIQCTRKEASDQWWQKTHLWLLWQRDKRWRFIEARPWGTF